MNVMDMIMLVRAYYSVANLSIVCLYNRTEMRFINCKAVTLYALNMYGNIYQWDASDI